uniref:Protein NDRG3-like n=1 Tax=Sinocyclocheilus grahami TaxID=75366 RepID=A0A672RAD7_SINGR
MSSSDWLQEHDSSRSHGVLHVTLRGTPKGNRPVILTYHDIGLNRKLSHIFSKFLSFSGKMYHYTAHLLEEERDWFLDEYFSTLFLEEPDLNEPALVEGLVLINVDPCAKGWIDWAASKLSGWTSSLVDIVMAHHFSTDELTENQEIIQTYRLHIAQDINQDNLALFCHSYNSRQDLEIERPVLGLNENTVKTLKCPALLIVGDTSPAVEAVVECNSRLNPTKTTLLKMADCGGLPQVVQPGKLAEAFKYFVQGMGYMPTASMTRLARSRTHSASSMGSADGSRSRAHTSSQMEGFVLIRLSSSSNHLISFK